MSFRLKKQIAVVMADGRERTTNDIERKVTLPKRPGALTKALREMKEMGLLTSCKAEQDVIWRASL